MAVTVVVAEVAVTLMFLQVAGGGGWWRNYSRKPAAGRRFSWSLRLPARAHEGNLDARRLRRMLASARPSRSAGARRSSAPIGAYRRRYSLVNLRFTLRDISTPPPGHGLLTLKDLAPEIW